jgi:peptidoglycan hydrolase-like protein with peptidoglycan-binding domain
MNQRVIDAILSGQDIDHSNDANDHAYIQQQYDSAFSQCMASRGENVPGLSPAPAVASAGAVPEPPDPVIRGTQVELIRLGYLTGAADGYRGPRTRSAILAYERANGLAADGTASPRLLARLQASSAGAPTAAAPANWVAPASGAAASPAAAPSGWVSPTSGPAGPSASATGPSGWVAPTKGP